MAMARVSSCQLDQYWRSDCQLRVSKLGDIQVKSNFDFCTTPPLLDVSVQVEQHTWKLAFIASNRRESRIIGLEYWPLRLHVDFFSSRVGSGQSILGCVESLKNGEGFCFLNTTLGTDFGPYPPCQSTNRASNSSTTSIAILCFLITVLFISCSIASVVWWRRRYFTKTRTRKFQTCVPPLPNSKPYVDSPGHGKYSRPAAPTASKSRTLNPITEEESINGHLLISVDVTDRSKNKSAKCRESKLIQTSLPSLEDAQILLVDGDRSTPSSGCPHGNGSIISPSRVSDKEKLICSSSSSESSV